MYIFRSQRTLLLTAPLMSSTSAVATVTIASAVAAAIQDDAPVTVTPTTVLTTTAKKVIPVETLTSHVTKETAVALIPTSPATPDVKFVLTFFPLCLRLKTHTKAQPWWLQWRVCLTSRHVFRVRLLSARVRLLSALSFHLWTPPTGHCWRLFLPSCANFKTESAARETNARCPMLWEGKKSFFPRATVCLRIGWVANPKGWAFAPKLTAKPMPPCLPLTPSLGKVDSFGTTE